MNFFMSVSTDFFFLQYKVHAELKACCIKFPETKAPSGMPVLSDSFTLLALGYEFKLNRFPAKVMSIS